MAQLTGSRAAESHGNNSRYSQTQSSAGKKRKAETDADPGPDSKQNPSQRIKSGEYDPASDQNSYPGKKQSHPGQKQFGGPNGRHPYQPRYGNDTGNGNGNWSTPQNAYAGSNGYRQSNMLAPNTLKQHQKPFSAVVGPGLRFSPVQFFPPMTPMTQMMNNVLMVNTGSQTSNSFASFAGPGQTPVNNNTKKTSTQPVAKAGESSETSKVTSDEKRVCVFFNTPTGCTKKDCPFVHNRNAKANTSFTKEILCKAIARGEVCRNGKKCSFSHDPDKTPPMKKPCRNGKDCKIPGCSFLHQDNNDFMKQQQDKMYQELKIKELEQQIERERLQIEMVKAKTFGATKSPSSGPDGSKGDFLFRSGVAVFTDLWRVEKAEADTDQVLHIKPEEDSASTNEEVSKSSSSPEEKVNGWLSELKMIEAIIERTIEEGNDFDWEITDGDIRSRSMELKATAAMRKAERYGGDKTGGGGVKKIGCGTSCANEVNTGANEIDAVIKKEEDAGASQTVIKKEEDVGEVEINIKVEDGTADEGNDTIGKLENDFEIDFDFDSKSQSPGVKSEGSTTLIDDKHEAIEEIADANLHGAVNIEDEKATIDTDAVIDSTEKTADASICLGIKTEDDEANVADAAVTGTTEEVAGANTHSVPKTKDDEAKLDLDISETSNDNDEDVVQSPDTEGGVDNKKHPVLGKRKHEEANVIGNATVNICRPVEEDFPAPAAKKRKSKGPAADPVTEPDFEVLLQLTPPASPKQGIKRRRSEADDLTGGDGKKVKREKCHDISVVGDSEAPSTRKIATPKTRYTNTASESGIVIEVKGIDSPARSSSGDTRSSIAKVDSNIHQSGNGPVSHGDYLKWRLALGRPTLSKNKVEYYRRYGEYKKELKARGIATGYPPEEKVSMLKFFKVRSRPRATDRNGSTV